MAESTHYTNSFLFNELLQLPFEIMMPRKPELMLACQENRRLFAMPSEVAASVTHDSVPL